MIELENESRAALRACKPWLAMLPAAEGQIGVAASAMLCASYEPFGPVVIPIPDVPMLRLFVSWQPVELR